jgi:hypothetical protein
MRSQLKVWYFTRYCPFATKPTSSGNVLSIYYNGPIRFLSSTVEAWTKPGRSCRTTRRETNAYVHSGRRLFSFPKRAFAVGCSIKLATRCTTAIGFYESMPTSFTTFRLRISSARACGRTKLSPTINTTILNFWNPKSRTGKPVWKRLPIENAQFTNVAGGTSRACTVSRDSAGTVLPCSGPLPFHFHSTRDLSRASGCQFAIIRIAIPCNWSDGADYEP